MNRAPLGVIDSGVGGLTVVKAIRSLLPNESIEYFGDTARLPYGDKSRQAIVRFARQCAEFLVYRGVKLLVIACNTASAHALETLQEELPIPVIGVISTTASLACAVSATGRIGVIATRQTIASGVYQTSILRERPQALIWSHACPLFVPLAEEYYWNHPITKAIVEEYLHPMRQEGCDTLVLGCTHYPLLIDAIREVVGHHVQLIDPAATCAQSVATTLTSRNLQAPKGTADLKLFVSDDPQRVATLGSQFLGQPLTQVASVTHDSDGRYRCQD